MTNKLITSVAAGALFASVAAFRTDRLRSGCRTQPAQPNAMQKFHDRAGSRADGTGRWAQ